jgi:hypothetical protein
MSHTREISPSGGIKTNEGWNHSAHELTIREQSKHQARSLKLALREKAVVPHTLFKNGPSFVTSGLGFCLVDVLESVDDMTGE